MNCPKCLQELQKREINSVELHDCSQCQGSWFSQANLRKLKDQTDPDLNWMDFELWEDMEQIQLAPAQIQCPECKLELISIDYDKTGVEVEICRQCQGVWLDTGKFERIIEALREELETKSVSEYIKESLDEAKQIVIGPEDPISEWRDFLTVVRMLHYRILADNPKLQEALLRLQQGLPK